MIERFTSSDPLPERWRNGVVAIGNFDGVHRGHQVVLARAIDIAKDNNVPAIVMTFEPHPRAVFSPDHPPFRISPAELKALLLQNLGFDGVVEQAFTKEFASHSASEFIEDILIKRLGVSHIVTGFDFHFGKGREGGPAFMMEAGQDHGFGVTLVDAFRDENAEVVSSSRIRALLKDGKVNEAAGLLGYHFTVLAKVVKGKQLGRTLGYPTANMVLEAGDELKHGIYAVRFFDEAGQAFDGVASFGIRPTVESDGAPLLETFLFDFEGDLYGQTCQVSLICFLRGEEKFDDLDALVVQMKQDEAEAREVLTHVSPISPLDRTICFKHG